MIEILLSPNEPHTLKYLKINLRHFCVTERLEDNGACTGRGGGGQPVRGKRPLMVTPRRKNKNSV